MAPAQMAKPKNKFQLKREATLSSLVQAGYEVLCEKGYATTTVEELVTRAGYTKGAFYVHFTSKEQFFLFLVEQRATELRDFLATLVEDSSQQPALSLEATVEALLQDLVTYLKESSAWLVVHMEFFIHTRQQESIRATYAELYDQVLDEMARLLDRFKEGGLIRPHLDSRRTAADFYAYADGCVTHHVLYGAELDAAALARVFLAMVG